jgi:hypothetical protein
MECSKSGSTLPTRRAASALISTMLPVIESQSCGAWPGRIRTTRIGRQADGRSSPP